MTNFYINDMGYLGSVEPTGNHIILPGSGSVCLKYNGGYIQNDLQLEVYFGEQFTPEEKNDLGKFIRDTFDSYYMPNRVLITENEGTMIRKQSIGSSYFDEAFEIINFRYQNNNPNLLSLIHELIHACIYQIDHSVFEEHSSDYYEGLCKNLLVVSSFSPGILLDIKTLLRANFSNASLYVPSELRFLIPAIDFIYSMFEGYCDGNCTLSEIESIQDVLPNRSINSGNGDSPIINVPKRKRFTFKSETDFFKRKFEAEYIYLKKHLKGIKKKEYIKMNLLDLNRRLKIKGVLKKVNKK